MFQPVRCAGGEKGRGHLAHPCHRLLACSATGCSYNVIIADVLVGSAPRYTGFLPTLLGRHDSPWWLSRPCVLAALLCAVVLPMLIPRNLAAVARFSRFSVGMVLFLAASISGLAAAAVAEGRVAPDVRLLPDFAAMGGGLPLGILTSLLTVVSGGWAGRQGGIAWCRLAIGSAPQAPSWPPLSGFLSAHPAALHFCPPTLLNACVQSAAWRLPCTFSYCQ